MNGSSPEAKRYRFGNSGNLIMYANTRAHRVCQCCPGYFVLDAFFHLQDVDVCGARETDRRHLVPGYGWFVVAELFVCIAAGVSIYKSRCKNALSNCCRVAGNCQLPVFCGRSVVGSLWRDAACWCGSEFPCDRGGLVRGRSFERSEEHTSELQSLRHLVCRLLLEKKKKN